MEGNKPRKRGRPPDRRRTYMTQDSYGNVIREHLSPFKVQKLTVGDVSTSDQQNSLLGQHDRLTGNISKQPHLADGVDNPHSPVSHAQHRPPAHCLVKTSKQTPQELITSLRKTPLKDAVLVLAPTCVAKQDEKFHFNKGMPPPWWPPAVSFEVFTKKTQDELVVLLLALMDHTRVKLGLLDDFKRALRGARRK